MIKNCVVCGKQFSTNRTRQIACSPVCIYQNMKNKACEKQRKPKIKKICPACGKIFLTARQRQIYCTRACCRRARHLREYPLKTEKPVICANCGKEFLSARKNAKFCSRKCDKQNWIKLRSQYRAENKKTTKTPKPIKPPRPQKPKKEKPFKLTSVQIAQRERLKQELLKRRMLREQEKSDFFEGMYYDDESNFTPPLPTQIY